ncbi:MAG: hypothetical protein NXI31_15075 [bacterium]|nr:hypothetical protein [bacterium]
MIRRTWTLVAPVLLATGLSAQIFPAPPEPAGNPSTPGKVALGKALFWDEQLSSSRSVACGTCHRWDSGGADPRTDSVHPGADGVFGTADDVVGSPGVVRHDASGAWLEDALFGVQPKVTPRKSPSPINAAYLTELFWDGRADDVFRDPVTNQVVLASGAALENQAAGPPVDEGEMSHVGRSWTDIANDLPNLTPLALATNVPAALQTFINGQTYAQLFQQVYGTAGVTPQRIIFAIAAYQRALVSDQSPFDRSLVGQYTFTPQENLGRLQFNALCRNCHTDLEASVRFTGPTFPTGRYRNIGVRPFAEDPGRFNVTQVVLDSGKFKVPGLRNVELRAPYFHNGSEATLLDVIDFYARGGNTNVNQDPLIFNILGAISPNDRTNMVAFLRTLTDPRVVNQQPPFDRPTLWSETANVPTTFGTGTAGTGGLTPRANAWEPGLLGNPKVTIGVDRVQPSTFAFIAWDLFANQAPTAVLGHNVYLAQSGAMATSGVGLTQGSGPGNGFASLTFSLPPDPAFAGATLFGQWLLVDANGPVGFSSSNAFGVKLFQ